ncbi:antirestriction protein ArdA [Rhodococcus sp. NPDC003382]
MSHEQPSTHGEDEASSERRSTPGPRIYVASLADYNAGRLHGAWLDAGRDPADLQADIRAMLAAAPEPGAEEYAIHDYEGFGEARIYEHDSLELVSRIARGIAAHGLAFAAWADIQPDLHRFSAPVRGPVAPGL